MSKEVFYTETYVNKTLMREKLLGGGGVVLSNFRPESGMGSSTTQDFVFSSIGVETAQQYSSPSPPTRYAGQRRAATLQCIVRGVREENFREPPTHPSSAPLRRTTVLSNRLNQIQFSSTKENRIVWMVVGYA